MKTVGYFDGTDSNLLSKLAASGYCTLPIGNEWDNHGKTASHLEPGEVHLIITYLHKLLPAREVVKKAIPIPMDLLYPAKAYHIPVLVVVPEGFQKKAEKVLGEVVEFIEIIAPDKLEARVREILDF